jgi:hypothetical protein
VEKYIQIKCCQCGDSFQRLYRVQRDKPLKAKRLGRNPSDNNFCSNKCYGSFIKKEHTVVANCGWCNKEVIRNSAEFNKSKSGLIFCNRSCSVSFNNTKRRKSKRSKCEKMLFDLLLEKYPDLGLIPNGKSMLDGLECDIEIQSLKLAIEWNGIVHYKPIYGEEKLQKIQSIDEKKQNLAQEKGIRLIVIPDLVSNKKYVNEAFHSICHIFDELSLNLFQEAKSETL